MRIIIDANRPGIFLSSPQDENVAPIHEWLNRRHGFLVYSTGAEFANEIGAKARKQLQGYVQAGSAKLISSSELEADKQYLQRDSNVKSDDHHILALARVSGSRLLYTCDKNLKTDFKNKSLIDTPRGKIYSGKQNEKELLMKWRCPSTD